MNKPTPPRLFLRFFEWYCRDGLQETILGDLEEQFEEDVQAFGPSKARRRFVWNVIRFFRPGIIRTMKGTQKLNSIDMLQHNLILTLRNFKRHKSSFFINLIGLSTGLACVLFIYLWVSDERSMDGFHQQDAQLYQIMTNRTDASGTSTWRGVPGLLLDEIQATIPEVVHAVATTDTHEYTLSADDDSFKAQGKFASTDFFDVFTYPLIRENKSNLLQDKSGIIVTESLAQRIFGQDDPMGQQLTWHFWGREKLVQVIGIMEDQPTNSSDHFDFLMSWDYYHDDLITYKQWGNYYGRIFLTLNPTANPEAINAKITDIIREKQQNDKVELFLAKYSDRYLYDKYENGKVAGGRIEYVRLFTIIAVFILFIASVNFINLSTAKASHRIKEIGVKKSMGASRKSLMSQYFTESILLSILSILVAFALVWLLLPQFNYLSQKQLILRPDLPLLIITASLIGVVGILAGSYPALYLSGIKTLEVLKGKLVRKSSESWSRGALVILQFTLSIILITAVIVVFRQMDYVQNKNLGYDKENLLYFEREGKLLENSEALVKEIQNIPGVLNAGVSGFMVGGGNSTGGVSWEGKTPEDQVDFWETNTGNNTMKLLGIELVAGRDFSEEYGIDSAGIIFNETAIKAMGMTDPIGKKVRHYTGEKTIIGVVKDFNLISLHSQMEPMLFHYNPDRTHFIMARLAPGTEVSTIQSIEKRFEAFNPGFPFKPLFVDQDYQALYASEMRISVLSRYFAGFAILISSLGLFGLAAFTAERRIKEIGIRKILGSSVVGIIVMLSKDFTKMVGIAILIALPVSYFVTRNWLENFAYAINLEWWFFAGSAMIALVIAWLTVGLQTYKAATVNPTECLRDE